MAVKLKFDSCHNPILPTLVLANRNGDKVGILPANSVKFSNRFNSYNEMSFYVYKSVLDNDTIWESIKDFALLWVKEWDLWFEIQISLEESNAIVKKIVATSLGEAELSQINVYDISVNTEDDIARDDYIPTVIYDSVNADISLLDKIMAFAPHYKIKSVSSSIQPLKRVFEFDGTNIHDALQKVSSGINCLFDFSVHSDENGMPDRSIKVYDLESYCFECGHRGEFITQCEKCNSTNIMPGYGEDSRIIVSTANLADNIEYKADSKSVKNCFKLEAGDKTMTDAIASCNPNGSNYIWFISDEVKADMPSDLSEKINAYDDLYAYYTNDYTINPDTDKKTAYNALIAKYGKSENLPDTITGYSALMDAYMSIVDFKGFLQKSMMPSVETSAQAEAAYLTTNFSTVAIDNISSAQLSTVESAVIAMAKIMVNNQCTVSINSSAYDESTYTWNGSFNVEYNGEKATTGSIYATITDNNKYRVLQAAQKEIYASSADISDAVSLFDLGDIAFGEALTHYSLAGLNTIKECCNGAINVLIENGAGNADVWADTDNDLYVELYQPFNNRLSDIDAEITLRKAEINTITDIQKHLDTFISGIQVDLNFKDYLGEESWLQFIAYQREQVFSNNDYSSDGLSNADIMNYARLFIDSANKELIRAATHQHSINATLKNLLTMPEFDGFTDYFDIGNWIHIMCDDGVYDLRLLSYDIDFDNLSNLPVTFSDVRESKDGCLRVSDILKQSSAMATSYGSVSRQAEKGNDSRNRLDGWAENGLALTAMKIVNDADNQNYEFDSHGMLFRKYLPLSDTYDDEQLKIVNSTIAITNDKWNTVKTAIGKHYFIDPLTNEFKYGYGINGEVLIGKIILGEQLGIYNSGASLQFNKNGLTITNDAYTFKVSPNDENSLVSICNAKNAKIFDVTPNGDLYIKGEIHATSGTIGDCSIINGVFTADAANIKSGVFDKARIPYLSADKVDVSGIIAVGGIATTDDIPTSLSELTNDSGFIDAGDATIITENYIKTTDVIAENLYVNAGHILGSLTIGQLPSTVAQTSDIPTKLSELTNDSGYKNYSGVVSIINGTVTADFVEALGIQAASIVIENSSGYELLKASGNTVKIGDFTVGRNSSRSYLYSNSHSSLSDTSYSGVYIGTDGLSIFGSGGANYVKLDVANSNFEFKGKVIATSGEFSGELKAATGSFSGHVEAETGNIGGWVIGWDSNLNMSVTRSPEGIYGRISWTTTGTDYRYIEGYIFTALTPIGLAYVIKEGSSYSSTTLGAFSSLDVIGCTFTSGSSSGGDGFVTI